MVLGSQLSESGLVDGWHAFNRLRKFGLSLEAL